MFISLRNYNNALCIKCLYTWYTVVLTLSFKAYNAIKSSMAQFMGPWGEHLLVL
jgi:hypothetical protein